MYDANGLMPRENGQRDPNTASPDAWRSRPGSAPRNQARGLARPAGSGAEARPRTRGARRDRLLGRFAGEAGGQPGRPAPGPAAARPPALGEAARRRLSLPLRGLDPRPLSRGLLS